MEKFVLYFLYFINVSFGCCRPDLVSYVMIGLMYILYRLNLMAIFSVLFLDNTG